MVMQYISIGNFKRTHNKDLWLIEFHYMKSLLASANNE